MKLILIAVLFIAAASAFNFLETKSDIKFNLTEALLGANEQLNLVSDEQAQACAEAILPALQYSAAFSQSIENLNLKLALEYVNPLKSALDNFNTVCPGPVDAYANYFEGAVAAFQANRDVFFENVKHNIVSQKNEAIGHALEVAANVIDNNDAAVGANVVELVQIGLSNYLPNATVIAI